jgi:hypothetical protein
MLPTRTAVPRIRSRLTRIDPSRAACTIRMWLLARAELYMSVVVFQQGTSRDILHAVTVSSLLIA